jgi:hypothetical protein
MKNTYNTTFGAHWKFHSTRFSHLSPKYPDIIMKAMHIETFAMPALPNYL